MKTKSKTSDIAVLTVFLAGMFLGNILEYKRIMGFEPAQIAGILISLATAIGCYIFLRKGFK